MLCFPTGRAVISKMPERILPEPANVSVAFSHYRSGMWGFQCPVKRTSLGKVSVYVRPGARCHKAKVVHRVLGLI